MHGLTTNLTLNKANKITMEIHNLTSLPLWFVEFSPYFNWFLSFPLYFNLVHNFSIVETNFLYWLFATLSILIQEIMIEAKFIPH